MTHSIKRISARNPVLSTVSALALLSGMTTMLHVLDSDDIDKKLVDAELDYVLNSEAGLKTIAENYVGLPFDRLV